MALDMSIPYAGVFRRTPLVLWAAALSCIVVLILQGLIFIVYGFIEQDYPRAVGQIPGALLAGICAFVFNWLAVLSRVVIQQVDRFGRPADGGGTDDLRP